MLVLTGCAEGSDGQAEPASEAAAESSEVEPNSSDPGGSSDLPHSGAPAVADPLPKSALPQDPCDAVTPQQVETILGQQAQGERADQEETGLRCRWTDGAGAGFDIGYATETGQGLSAFYANTQPQMEIFQAVDPVSGFPAVEYKTGHDDSLCTVVVGLADDYAVGASVAQTVEANAEGQDPCEPAAKVAELVVENLGTNAVG
ncbi:DUF3558 domain-containing protein [Saccharomonospora sp. CUA-673]|uniref:DUF3558 domain-containing protein n=1 Tax=Saccharomonospora sp. CUA-673 TaxID=1904969 RepID=UPI0021007720|nr:DUF3558 domain-containing protein [Saccharomonospora sp. CUA-673]